MISESVRFDTPDGIACREKFRYCNHYLDAILEGVGLKERSLPNFSAFFRRRSNGKYVFVA